MSAKPFNRVSSLPFVVYRIDTGQITRMGQCPETDVDAQANRPDLAVIVGLADPETQYVRDGEVADLPDMPCEGAEFDFDHHVWRCPDADSRRERENASAYLAATDWLVTRLAETGKEIPLEVKDARAAARELLSGP